VLAFSLMAVWAGTAQAEETGGKWTYLTKAEELKTFEGALAEPEVGGKLEAGTVLILHTKVLGTSLLYECKALTINSGKLKTNGVLLGKLTFTECEAFFSGVLSKNCSPSGGKIETVLIKAQMLLHKLVSGTIDKVLIGTPEDASGNPITNFATIKSTEACSIGENVQIGGKIAWQDPSGTGHAITHLVTEFAPLNHLYVISDTVEHAANILGSAETFLTGAHVGIKWAGLWN
jgi:hypothetical protein